MTKYFYRSFERYWENCRVDVIASTALQAILSADTPGSVEEKGCAYWQAGARTCPRYLRNRANV